MQNLIAAANAFVKGAALDLLSGVIVGQTFCREIFSSRTGEFGGALPGECRGCFSWVEWAYSKFTIIVQSVLLPDLKAKHGNSSWQRLHTSVYFEKW